MKNITLRFLIFFLSFSIGLSNIHAQITGSTNVCSGQNYPYSTALSGTITWSVSPAGASVVSAGSTSQITWNVPAGAYTIVATDGYNNETYSVNVYDVPAPVLQYNKNPCSIPKEGNNGGAGEPDFKCDSFCVNEVVTYSVANTPGNTYAWNFYPATAGTIISGQGTNSVMVIWAQGSGGTQPDCRSLCLEETNPAGCKTQACANGIAAYLTSPITLSASPSYVCLGNAITFTANTTGTYQNYTWDFGNGNIITTTPNSASYTYPIAGTYTVIVTGNAKCCHESDTITVVVDSLPGPDIYCITPVCANTDSVQYCTNATNCTFSWVVTGGTIVGSSSGSCITVNWGAGPVGTISLTATNCNPLLCPATTTVNVPIMPNGPFAINGPVNVCINSTGTYTAPFVPGTQYTWTMTDPLLNTTTLAYNIPPNVQNYTFTMMGIYVLKCHMKNDILECEGDGTITINVIDSMILFGPTTACVDLVNPTTFNSLFSNFTSLNCDWTSSPNIGSFSNTPSASFMFTSPGTYIITATESVTGSVCNSPKSITVVVNPTPATPVITGPVTVCPGGTYAYSVSGYSQGASINWFLNEGVNYPSGNGTSFTGTFPVGFTSGTLSVTVTENGCSSTSTININSPSPPSPVIAVQNISVCPGASTSYSVTLTYPLLSTVLWSIAPSSAGTITAGQGTNTITVLWNSGFTSATITVTETTCLIQTGTDNLSVTILSPPSTSASATTVCSNGNTTLSATGGVSYDWFLSNGSSIGSGNPLNTPFVAPGNYYVVTMGANGCTATAYTQAVQLPEPVVSIFGPVSTACDPATGNFISPQTLQTFNGYGYTFIWSNGSTASSTSVSQAGTYTVTVTNSSGCSKSQTWAIGCACGSPCPVCVDGGSCTNSILNSPATLTAPAGSSYLWSPGGQTTQSIATTIAGVLYSVVVSDNSNLACPTTTYSYYLHCAGDTCPYTNSGNSCVANAPVVTQTNTYCNIVSFQTNTTGTCNGVASWSFGDGAIGSGNNPTHTYSQAGVYQVCYSYAGNSVCDPAATACTTVTVPLAADFSSVVSCNTVQFTDLSNYLSPSILTYMWSFGDPGNNTSTLPNPSFTYPGGGTYIVTLTVTVAGGCQAQITLPVVVVAPSITAIAQATACNNPVQFTGTVNGGSTFIVGWNWNFGDASSSSLQNPQHSYTPGMYYWTVTVTDGAGCTTTVNDSILVSAPPPPFNLTPDTSCGPAVLNAPGAYLTYAWYNNGSPIVPAANNQTYLATQSGNYSVEVTDANGCLIMSNPAVVVINPIPPVALTVAPQPICSSGNLTVNSNTSGNVTVVWTSNIIQLPISQGYSIQWSNVPAGNYTVSCVITDNVTGCSLNDSISFTVNQSPFVFISNSNPGGVCSGIPITLTANGSPVVAYSWSNNAVTPSISVSSGGTYGVTVTSANGCTAAASSVAQIFPLPYLQMLPIGCDSACINPVADTINGPPGMAGYDWQVNGITIGTNQNLVLDNIILPNYNVPYQITLIATTNNGCIDSTKFYYTPKECDSLVSHCYTMKDTIWCNLDGTYSFQLYVENNHATSSASIMLHQFSVPFLVAAPPYYVPSPLYYQFLNLPPGGNSGWFPSSPLILSVPPNATMPPEFCFKSMIIYGDTCCYDSLCIDIPDCNPCENIGITSTSDDSSCCKTVSLYNNFNGGYFSGIQVTPVTPGATIGTTYLGGAYTGTWNSPVNNASTVIYQPNGGGFIPTGNTPGLFSMCLSLAPGTPSPQIVILNWLTPNVHGEDSVACTDTLIFHCESDPKNPCGTVEDTIICLGNEMYQYSFTLTNNSPNPISMAAVDYLSIIQPPGFPLVFFYNPPLAPGASYTQTFTFSSSLPAGSVICYHITLLDSIGCCCHTVDTICFTIPECDSVECACGSFTPFDVVITTPPISGVTYPQLACGTTIDGLIPNSQISFNGVGFTCQGDSTCESVLTWTVTGNATPTSGTGLPYFTIISGSVTVSVIGHCGALACDTCTYTFVTEPKAACDCGHWDLFTVNIEGGGIIINTFAECNEQVPNVAPNSLITFTGGGYSCSGDPSCLAQISWSVSGNAFPLSGTGLPVFTVISGTVTVTLTSACGPNKCEDCIVTFITAEPCDCGVWEPFTITTSSASYINQSCGTIYGSKPNFPITLSGNHDCSGGSSCSATYSWVINRNNIFFLNGTGLPVTFTPTQLGTYVISISAVCGGLDCETCQFTFKVKNQFGLSEPNNGESYFDNENFSGPLNNEGQVQLSIEPNPANELINVLVESPVKEKGQLVLYNDLGIALLVADVQLTKGVIKHSWFAKDLPAGVYTVRYLGAAQAVISRVVVSK